VALLGRQREIFKMGLAVVARIYPYDHARAPSHREIIVHAKAYPASSPTTKPSGILAPHASTGQVGGEWDIQQGNGFFECM
jgi:hypothetical protein